MRFVHLVIETIYILCPAVMLIRAIVIKTRATHPRSLPLRKFRLTSLTGMAVGVLVAVTFAISVHGRLLLSQVLLAGYFATSLILILQGLDRLSWHLCKFSLRLGDRPLPTFSYHFRAFVVLVVRAALVFCVGLPYVLATMMTYRPRAASIDNPQTLFHWNYEPITFAATDGTRLAGWWIPSPRGESPATVILCPGTDKASQLSLVRRLQPAGYNVLVFDFRGSGDSSGQLCSFGDLERRDVLGAVRWLREKHPSAAQKVAGLGVGTGGAALLAAAADPSIEGQNLDAIAVYDTYDRLDHQVDTVVDQFVPMPLGWFVRHVGLPIAGLQVGADLNSFAPAEEIKSIWPRPVLVIHRMDDQFIPFEEGESLYESALQPKDFFWIQIRRSEMPDAIDSPESAQMVKDCFDRARRVI